VRRRIPILSWLVSNPGYDWKNDFTQDLFAGVTISAVIIPQSMAYAMLASLPAVHGLYTSLVPTALYAVLGTSKHMSTGTFAITSLLLGQFAHKVLSDQGFGDDLLPDGEYQRRYLPTCLMLTAVVGGVQILLSMARLGRWTSRHLLPTALVSGFNTASAFHIGTHQLKHWLGMKPPREGGVFSMIRTWIWIVQHFWNDTVWPSLAMGLGAMIFMYILQRIEYWRRRMCIPQVHLPIPDIFICVVVFTVATVIFDLDTVYGIEVIGMIPTGLPTMAWPGSYIGAWTSQDWVPLLWPGTLMAMVVYVMSLSVAKHFGREYGYEIDADQEMLALGVSSLVGSCFGGYACTGNLTRSAILAQLGAKTALASLVGAFMVLMSLLWFTVLFERIPNTVLAAIVLVALKSLFAHTVEVKRLWRVGRRKEALIWWTTFISVIVFSIEIGLAVGVSLVVVLKLYKHGMKWKRVAGRYIKHSATYQRIMLMLGLHSPLFTTAGRGLYTNDDEDDY
ncbi:MAG: sulfate transporter family-domain-containing protein, partial [Linnemannia gamsii]